jgi:ADP-ribose pyrophosphatase YjhB (NUDIX family)/diadenosine tetraphosphate (Ap4A) HIT family hydrolase
MAKRPRTGAYALIVRDDAVLLAQQTRGPFGGYWNLPGGAIDFGESVAQALTRECREELGAPIEVGELLTVAESSVRLEHWSGHLIGIVHWATLKAEPRLHGNNDDIGAVCWWPLTELPLAEISPVALTALKQAGLIDAQTQAPLPGCFACTQLAQREQLPPRLRIYDDGLWWVAHSFNSALPGWLVLQPQRHVTSLAQLTAAESAELGPLLQQLSSALTTVVGCAKTYVVLFAELERFTHLHFHVIPRAANLPSDLIGSAIFGYLRQPPAEWVPAEEMDRIGLAVAEELRRLR